MDTDGSERLEPLCKSIVQVGTLSRGPQGQGAKPVGLPLDRA